MRKLIVISGPVCSGKTTLASDLSYAFGCQVRRTKDWLRGGGRKGVAAKRKDLQAAGDDLDRRTGGEWIVQALTRELPALANSIVVIDSARTNDQIAQLRKSFGAIVTHIHLDAPDEELEARFDRRPKRGGREPPTYAAVRKNATERKIRDLARTADVVVNTQRCTPRDVLIRAASHLELLSMPGGGYVDVLVGGQFGSEGKGHVAAFLSSEYDLLVRVGGPNAGHTVFEEPEPYTFHHLPSGTRATQAQLLLGPGTVIDLQRLQDEISECHVEKGRLIIDSNAIMITGEDKDIEKALRESMGSTGQGVGAATVRRIMERGSDPLPCRAKDVPELAQFVGNSLEVLANALAAGKRILLEGTQGTGLSLYHGEYPWVTSRDTTVSGCLAEAGIAPGRVRRVVMVCRTYPIRVESPSAGTSGPMSHEIDWKEVSHRSGIPLDELESTERTSTTDRKRRVGEFDWELLRKASLLNAPTDVAITFADYHTKKNRRAYRFDQLHPETIGFVNEVEKVSGARVSLISTDFRHRSIIDRRLW